MEKHTLPPQLTNVNTCRIGYLDTVRVVACLMVVLVHAPHPHASIDVSGGWLYGMISYLCSPCIGLFLMVSGALLFPVKLSGREFLKRRLGRIVFPLIIWSAIALSTCALMGEITWNDAFYRFLRFPLFTVKGFEHGWYLYFLIGIYLFIPIIGVWIAKASKRGLQYFLVIWLFAMCMPYITAIFGGMDKRLFAPFAGMFGYMLLGYYLHKYPIKFKSSWQWIGAVTAFLFIAVVFPALVYLSNLPGYNKVSQIVYNYESISTVAMCVAVFMLVQKFNPSGRLWDKVMADLSIKSFGIYLVHFIVIRRFLKPYFIENPMSDVFTEVFVTFALTLFVSYIVVWAIGFLPFKKYIIG